MRKLSILLFSIVGGLTMGLVWTVGETGLTDVNAHLCEFAHRYAPAIPLDCQASDWIVSVAGWLFIVAILVFVADVAWIVATWHGRKSSKPGEEARRLEIHFDSANPLKRYWSFESPRDKDGKPLPGIQNEYRVAIFNPTLRTIRNISVLVESLGSAGPRPFRGVFDRTRTETCDLNPGCSEFAVVLHWPHPKVQAGMLAGASALNYGPLLVTVSADDVPPTTRQFWFDYQREPMLLDRLESDKPEHVS